MSYRVRVWDLPTRLFHWLLAGTVIALVATAKTGAMVWHVRLGYVVLALLLFRLVWGLVGGRWSRFSAFLHSPRTTWHYLRGRADASVSISHSPTGAASVFALLLVLAAQVGSGLLSDDEIAFQGPLTRFVPGDVVGFATGYHKDIGQWLVIGLVVLHVLAVLFYLWGKRQNLIAPMLHGDKQLAAAAPPSRDDAAVRLLAAVVIAASGAIAWWVSTL